MKWIVVEENPKPDDYIAIFNLKSEKYDETVFKGSHTVFIEKNDAVSRALEIAKLFDVEKIRIFYPQGHSEKVK